MTLFLGNQKVEIAEIEISVDNKTINFNSLNQLQSFATLNALNNTVLKLWVGESTQTGTKKTDTLYFLTDTKQVYIGNTLVANNFVNTDVLIDNKTIKRVSDKLQAQGIVNQQNANNIVKIWTGNNSAYSSLTPANDTLYFITDTGEIHLGSIVVATNVKVDNETIKKNAQDKIYVNIDNKSVVKNSSNQLTVNYDNSTIKSDSNNKLYVDAIKNQNSGIIKNWVGNQQQYDAIDTKDPNTLYYITDTRVIYYNGDIVSKSGDARNVGEIVASTIPLTDAGLHLLDGLLLQYGVYKEFIDYIASIYSTYPQCFCTETEWQSSVNTYGSCGKFVYNSSNKTVRLPKIEGFVQSSTDLSTTGDLVEQFVRLPNITGNFDGRGSTGTGANSTTRVSAGQSYWEGVDNSSWYSKSFDASRSSSVYSGDGTNTKVQPQSIKVLYYIVVANSLKTTVEVDINRIVTDLNNKVELDLTNCTRPYVKEPYIDGTSWYRVWSDGWCEQGGTMPVGMIAGTTSEYLIETNLLKRFLTENYHVNATIQGDGESNYILYDVVVLPYSKTTSSITFVVSPTTANSVLVPYFYWEAKGYIS